MAEKHRVFLANLDACNLVVLQLAFWVLGVGSMLATCAGLLVFFRRKGWV